MNDFEWESSPTAARKKSFVYPGSDVTSETASIRMGTADSASDQRAVMVALRMRPMNPTELTRGDKSAFNLYPDGKCFEVQNAKGKKESYEFNMCIDETQGQEEMFQTLTMQDHIEMAMEGYSVCIFAYGQTGSGKTYTISGPGEGEVLTGLVPRSCENLFQCIADKSSPDLEFSVRAANYEIYNEQVNDLLNPTSGNLPLRWHVDQGFYVENLYVVDCDGVDDLMEVVREGMRSRKVGSHEMNKDSSRSHQLIDITITRMQVDAEDSHPIYTYGRIQFIDLAGSERLKETKSTGEMVKETKDINRSLFMLSHVISKLGGSGHHHIPYRDSKLTKLLMNSLGGSSVTLMIACCSPSQHSIEESMRTLQYATRALNIKNRPIVNMNPQEQLIARLRGELQLMKAELDFFRDRGHSSMGTMVSERPSSATPITLGPVSPALKERDRMAKELVGQLQDENTRIKKELSICKSNLDSLRRTQKGLIQENERLVGKLENIEKIFVQQNSRPNSSPAPPTSARQWYKHSRERDSPKPPSGPHRVSSSDPLIPHHSSLNNLESDHKTTMKSERLSEPTPERLSEPSTSNTEDEITRSSQNAEMEELRAENTELQNVILRLQQLLAKKGAKKTS